MSACTACSQDEATSILLRMLRLCQPVTCTILAMVLLHSATQHHSVWYIPLKDVRQHLQVAVQGDVLDVQADHLSHMKLMWRATR